MSVPVPYSVYVRRRHSTVARLTAELRAGNISAETWQRARKYADEHLRFMGRIAQTRHKLSAERESHPFANAWNT